MPIGLNGFGSLNYPNNPRCHKQIALNSCEFELRRELQIFQPIFGSHRTLPPLLGVYHRPLIPLLSRSPFLPQHWIHMEIPSTPCGIATISSKVPDTKSVLPKSCLASPFLKSSASLPRQIMTRQQNRSFEVCFSVAFDDKVLRPETMTEVTFHPNIAPGSRHALATAYLSKKPKLETLILFFLGQKRFNSTLEDMNFKVQGPSMTLSELIGNIL